MTKLAKKIKKIKKNPRFAIFLGQDHADLDEFLSVVPTIFWYGVESTQRKNKNLIVVKDKKFLNSLNEVELVFVDDNEKNYVNDLQSLLIKSQPIIFLRTCNEVSIEQSNFFKSMRYHAVELFKGYQIWKHIP
jgi:hypothetical protein